MTNSPEGAVSSIGDVQDMSEESGGLSKADIKRNMICVIMLDAIFVTGYTDLMIALQPLLVYLHASNTMIGLITGANWAGLLGVFLSPWITRRFTYKKWYMFVAHVPYLAALGIAGLGVIYFHKLGFSRESLSVFMLVAFIAHWFFAGFVSLPHQEYVAAVIPMQYRGRYTGFSLSIGGVLSVLSALLGGAILLRVAKPMAFGYLFILAWAIMQAGYIAALFAKERPTPVEKSPPPWSRSMLITAWNDKPYVKLLAMNVFVCMLLFPMFGFINIYGFKDLHMIPATAAVIQMITQVVRIGLSFLIGIVTDRLGPKRMIPYWTLVAALAFLSPLLVRNAAGVYLSVAFSTLFGAGIMAAFMALIYGLPKPEHRAGHFTVQLIVIYAANALGPMICGRVCDLVSYKTAFLGAALLALAFFPISKYLAASLNDDIKSYS